MQTITKHAGANIGMATNSALSLESAKACFTGNDIIIDKPYRTWKTLGIMFCMLFLAVFTANSQTTTPTGISSPGEYSTRVKNTLSEENIDIDRLRLDQEFVFGNSIWLTGNQKYPLNIVTTKNLRFAPLKVQLYDLLPKGAERWMWVTTVTNRANKQVIYEAQFTDINNELVIVRIYKRDGSIEKFITEKTINEIVQTVILE